MEWFAVWDKKGGPRWIFQFWFYGFRPNVFDHLHEQVMASFHALGRPPAYVVADEENRPLHPAMVF